MRIYPSFVKPSHHNHKINYNNKTNAIFFGGKLEDDFFSASRSNNVQEQIKGLSNIGFDIQETDLITGDNFLHAALKSKSKLLINKALLLLGQKTNNNEELARDIVNRINLEGKKPYEYSTDPAIIERLNKIAKIEIAQQESSVDIIQTTQSNPFVQQEPILKLNELPEGTVLTIPDDEEDDDFVILSEQSKDTTPQVENESVLSLDEIAGLTKSKKILMNRIVNPLSNGKLVRDSGILLYSATKCGKSFLLKSLAKTLDKQIISIKDLEKLAEAVIDKNGNNSSKQQEAMA